MEKPSVCCLGVYAQTAENSVTLRHDVECAGVDAVALLVAHPALSGNTCLATGERQTSVPSLQPLQKQCEKPCRYGLPAPTTRWGFLHIPSKRCRRLSSSSGRADSRAIPGFCRPRRGLTLIPYHKIQADPSWHHVLACRWMGGCNDSAAVTIAAPSKTLSLSTNCPVGESAGNP